MNLKITIILVLFSLLPYNSFALTIENSHKDSLIKQGEAFFKNKQYAKAIDIYEALVDATNSSNKIQYNLAVAYYKNSQYIKSKKIFSALSSLPSFSSIALLNLGLISTQENDLTTARIYFRQSIKSDISGETSSLSRKMLLRLNKEYINKPKPKTWLRITSFNLGTENRTIDPTSEKISVIAKNNKFAALSAYVAKDILTRHTQKLNMSLNTFYKKNDNNSAFDFLLLSAALTKSIQYKNWKLIPSVSTNYMTLGGKKFESTIEGNIKFNRKFLKKHNFTFQYKMALVNGLGEEYAPFDGNQDKTRFQSQFRFIPMTITSYFEFERNNRANKTLNGTKFDYSPTRTKISFSLETKSFLSLKPKFEISSRESRYDIGKRLDRLLKIKAKLNYAFSRKTGVFLNIEGTQNNSDSNEYSYTRILFSLGIKHLAW